ncbi:GAF domain-containing protein [Amycolatopsis sp. NPDC049868]|uniref:sensor histidine kinase n=1 Tax=Amycolatopsis sp. NPDC049868 TaxID=3363934 RepID=UPI0037AFC7F9
MSDEVVDGDGPAGTSSWAGPVRPEVTTGGALTGLRLDELLREVQERLGEIIGTRDRLQGLLDAVLAVATGLELDWTLQRIVQAAADLVDARYGALGVLGENGGLSDFVSVGIDEETRATMGEHPRGKGLLGLLLQQPHPVRIPDLTRHPASVGFPANHPPMRSFLGAPILVRGQVFGNLYLTEKRGAPEFTADDEIVLRALAAAAGVAVENAGLFKRAKARERWLEAVAEINGGLLGGTTVTDTLDLVVDRVRELAAADRVVVVLADDGGRETMSVSAASGDLAEALLGARISVADTVIGEVLDSAEPLRSGHFAAMTRTEPESMVIGSGPAIVVPLTGSGGVGGVLMALRDKGAPPFKAEQVPMLAAFADQAAVALEFAEKQRDQRLVDVLADRARIARDLHDHVIQRLFATGMSLQSLLSKVGDEHAKAKVAAGVEQLDRTVREIRTSIFDLHGSSVDPAVSLRRRLLDAVAEIGVEAAVTPSIRIAGPVDTLVPGRLHEHAEAMLREILGDAVGSPGADRIDVDIEADSDELVITVAGNGTGAPAGPAERRGGTIERTGGPGGDTIVAWRVPLG